MNSKKALFTRWRFKLCLMDLSGGVPGVLDDNNEKFVISQASDLGIHIAGEHLAGSSESYKIEQGRQADDSGGCRTVDPTSLV